MKTHRGTCAGAFLAAAILAGCAQLEPAGRDSRNALEAIVCDRIANDSVSSAYRVHVDVAPGGAARVYGRVPDAGVAARIVAVIESTPGITGVENRLSIQPQGIR